MKAVLFDLDGTLIDSSEGIINSVLYTLEYYGIEELDRTKLYRFIGPPLDMSFSKYYGFDPKTAIEAVSKYRERYKPVGIYECKLYPGVRECLEKLKKEGYRIGMASSKPEESCRKIMEHFELTELFDDIVGATEDGRITTKEEVLEEVFSRWSDLPKEETCLIGDTIFDVEGANLHQIPCIVVSFGFGDMKEMLEAGAIARIDSFEQLPDTLQKLGEKK